jgi:hypothetical protein
LASDYDKILKENIAALFLPLSEKYLNIRIVRAEELKDKLQITIEKEPDFIRIVETDTGERFILHLEFQSTDEEGMIYRMQEYFGLLRRKYQLPVKQFVIYLGRKPSRMQTDLAAGEIFTRFTLKSLRDYSYESLLDSQVPEEIILAVLSNYNNQKPVEILRRILRKLQEVSTDEITLRKYIKQLSVLARLRNLTRETHKQISDMGLTYNITEDFLYKEGVIKGREEGREQAIKTFILKMLAEKIMSVEKIAEIADVPVAYVKEIEKTLTK